MPDRDLLDVLTEGCEVCRKALTMGMPPDGTVAYDIVEAAVDRTFAEHPNHDDDA